ncbi:hypothetical protein GGR90_000740 [Sphingopyxis italica]|uniref:Uncharacterized protein n=1 Tax=Sphingopyxis italica TaxID=1129133 RepID=A0A7X5XPL6_9SPHN|nr:hypothetical protein [Sphingopyxis italica]NJB88588.1 hypothetical protein [Sphingopyxis italica]
MSLERLRSIVALAVPTLFAQIHGGRIHCESEATLQLHLGRIIALAAELKAVGPFETFGIELEKPLTEDRGGRGRLDIWFRLTTGDGANWRCALELKLFKKANQREPNNRYDVFKDIARLERCGDVADLGFMLVATDHRHYIEQSEYSRDTRDFDFRDGKTYSAGSPLEYRTSKPHGAPITLASNYTFQWTPDESNLRYLLLEVIPIGPASTTPGAMQAV